MKSKILCFFLQLFGLIVYNDEMSEYYDYPEQKPKGKVVRLQEYQESLSGDA